MDERDTPVMAMRRGEGLGIVTVSLIESLGLDGRDGEDGLGMGMGMDHEHGMEHLGQGLVQYWDSG